MSVQVPSMTVHADSSLSIQEAAEALGCSEKTIRRRIKAGSLQAHRLPTSQGYEWRVHLKGTIDQAPGNDANHRDDQDGHLTGTDDHVDTGRADQVSTQPVPPSEAALLKALDLTDRLQRENMELAGRVGFLQARLQMAEEQLLALSAGAKQEETDAPPPAPNRHWWKALFRLS
jgi:excisionase family DNA binding protein